LSRVEVLAIVPPPLLSADRIREEEIPEALPVLAVWVRGALVGIALGMAVVFVIAARLNPYKADGSPRRLGTHRDLGLPPCTFLEATGLPCPSCGMTTSFALLVRGDVVNSLRANSAGTLLALFCLGFIPWAVASVARRRLLFIRSLERAMLWCVLGLMTLMLVRWLLLIGVSWWTGRTPAGG
jgi:hypothetical protein